MMNAPACAEDTAAGAMGRWLSVSQPGVTLEGAMLSYSAESSVSSESDSTHFVCLGASSSRTTGRAQHLRQLFRGPSGTITPRGGQQEGCSEGKLLWHRRGS